MQTARRTLFLKLSLTQGAKKRGVASMRAPLILHSARPGPCRPRALPPVRSCRRRNPPRLPRPCSCLPLPCPPRARPWHWGVVQGISGWLHPCLRCRPPLVRARPPARPQTAQARTRPPRTSPRPRPAPHKRRTSSRSLRTLRHPPRQRPLRLCRPMPAKRIGIACDGGITPAVLPRFLPIPRQKRPRQHLTLCRRVPTTPAPSDKRNRRRLREPRISRRRDRSLRRRVVSLPKRPMRTADTLH